MTARMPRLMRIVLPTLCLALAAQTPARAETAGQIDPGLQQQILANPGTDIAGGAGKTRVVEYFDYNCSFCKKLAPHLAQLQAESPAVSITYKEWPIFGGISVYAAKSALAAQWQGKYLTAHDALMGGTRLTQEAQVDGILKGAGVDIARLKQDLVAHAADINALLTRNASEARAIGLRGTPGLLVGRNVEINIAGLEDLKTAVAHAD